eukprot:8185343-Pyramimonas_sp.AAC.1
MPCASSVHESGLTPPSAARGPRQVGPGELLVAVQTERYTVTPRYRRRTRWRRTGPRAVVG